STLASTALPEQGYKLNVLLVTRGHPFDRDTFFDIFDSNSDIQYSNVEHPAAQFMFNPEMAKKFDCYVQYDMPGVEFGDGGPQYPEPPEFYKEGVRAMGEEGCPLVILHHCAAAWPAWPEWSEIVGGHFLYTPMKSRGVDRPDSGYNIDVTHTVSPAIDHPITRGIEPFEITDEVYLSEIFEDSIIPLFTSNWDFRRDNFYSASNAVVHGDLNSNKGWHHNDGSNVVGWIKAYKNSPVVYLQFGDGPAAYENPNFRRILAQAIKWASSDEAKSWAIEMHAASNLVKPE
ncbi:MAG: ThuA domain-containing protein, partial [Porticoccaceae bacterium]